VWRPAVGRRCGAIVVVALISTSCGARRHLVSPAVDSREGRTSVRILKEPEAESTDPDPSEERITPAYASSENKLPEYPAYALRAGCRDGIVPVRVYIGTNGNVAAQGDVPSRALLSDQCHMAFRAAVQSAVRDWKFAPAFRQKPMPGPDPRAPIMRWEQSPITIYLDFEFSFQVVQGKGVVHTR
jgi:outer membrane biosynthesis protein TonB